MNHVLVVCPNPSVDIYAHVSSFTVGVPNRIQSEERYPGGKGLHVAMALAELGLPVTIAGIWGGEAGQWIQQECNNYYPEIRFIGPVVKDWSRSCYTFKAESDFDDTEILGPGPTISETELNSLIGAISNEIHSTAAVALCGSWPKGSPETSYAQLVRLCNEHGVNSFLDCTGVQLTHALKENPFGVHLNRKEITEHFQLSFGDAKKAILKSCEVAAVTDGSKGLYLIDQQSETHALAKIEEVISAIGSGDCLLAGIIAGYVMNKSIQEIAQLGAACGAANCLRKDLGMLYKADVMKFLR